jgi:hypothetical protein
MKKTVLTFGLISGALAVGMMLATLPLINTHDFGKSDALGYTSMVLSALVVFFGVRSYRENVGAGRLTFGRGFSVGILITLVSCVCYVVTWELLYFKLMPGLGDRIAVCMVERARTSGASPQRIDEVTRQAQMIKTMSDNPATNVALAFAQSFPIGLVAAALSAAILRRKQARPIF